MTDDKNRLSCPICGVKPGALYDAFDPLFPGLPEEHGIAGYLPAVRCKTCGLGIEQTLSADPAGSYTPAYDAARDHEQGSGRWRRFHHDRAVAENRLTQISPHVKRAEHEAEKGLWVDVGCNNGAVLVAAANAGWRVLGIEQSDDTARQTEAVIGKPVMPYFLWPRGVNSARATSRGRKATVVSFFDVIEHLLDPIGALTAAAEYVVPGGLLVVEVPDLDTAPTDGSKWKHRRITPQFTEHIWHFSRKSLAALVANYLPGFAEVRSAHPVPGKLQMIWRKRDIEGEQLRVQAAQAGILSRSAAIGMHSGDYTVEIRQKLEDQRAEQKAQAFYGAQIGSETPPSEVPVVPESAPLSRLLQERLDRVRKNAGGG